MRDATARQRLQGIYAAEQEAVAVAAAAAAAAQAARTQLPKARTAGRAMLHSPAAATCTPAKRSAQDLAPDSARRARVDADTPNATSKGKGPAAEQPEPTPVRTKLRFGVVGCADHCTYIHAHTGLGDGGRGKAPSPTPQRRSARVAAPAAGLLHRV